MDDIRPAVKKKLQAADTATTAERPAQQEASPLQARPIGGGASRPPKQKRSGFLRRNMKMLVILVVIAAAIAALVLLRGDTQSKVLEVRSSTVTIDTIRLVLVRDENGAELEDPEVLVGRRGFGKIEYVNPDDGTKVRYTVLDSDGTSVHSGEFPLQKEKSSQLFGIPAIEQPGSYSIELFQGSDLLDTLKFKVVEPEQAEPATNDDSDEQAQDSAPVEVETPQENESEPVAEEVTEEPPAEQ